MTKKSHLIEDSRCMKLSIYEPVCVFSCVSVSVCVSVCVCDYLCVTLSVYMSK